MKNNHCKKVEDENLTPDPQTTPPNQWCQHSTTVIPAPPRSQASS